MHDIKFIRENPEDFDAGLARRGAGPLSATILELDVQVRAAQTEADKLLAERNGMSKSIGRFMAEGDHSAANAAKAVVESIKKGLPVLEAFQREKGTDLRDLMVSCPNLPAAEVPDGEDEAENVEVAIWGTPRKFNFQPKEHADLGPALGLDFETGALISGARFTFLRGQMARLQRALGQFMLDQQTSVNGYDECAPPLLVKDDAAFGTGQLPKFAEDLFKTDISYNELDYMNFKWKAYKELMALKGIQAKDALEMTNALVWHALPDPPTRRWLIPTAEVSLTNSVREQILSEAQLPIRLTALTPCFRSEAGAAGKDTRGYIRQHQFEKVELVT
ncbi:MAG: aminoacyl--tRNA ligase-related protein, partial [Novosphingobium sp.]